MFEPGPLTLLDEHAFWRVFHPDTPPPALPPSDSPALALAGLADVVDVNHADVLEHAGTDLDAEDDGDLDRVAADAAALANGEVPGDDADLRAAMLELDDELDKAVNLLAGEQRIGTKPPWIEPTGDDDFKRHDGDGEDGRPRI